MNVTEWTKSITLAKVVICGFFLFSFIVLLSNFENCLFFYFFLVYFNLFEGRAVSVFLGQTLPLEKKKIPGHVSRTQHINTWTKHNGWILEKFLVTDDFMDTDS